MTLRFPARIRTARTVLRAWRLDDGAFLKAGLDRNADHLVPWIPWATGEAVPLDQAEARVRSAAEEFAAGTNFSWAICSSDERQLWGGTGLHPRIGPGGVEIGYWVDQQETGRGLASEVAAVMLETAFSAAEVDRVEIHVDERNVPSRRIPVRLGFSLVEEVQQSPTVRLQHWRLLRSEFGHASDSTGTP